MLGVAKTEDDRTKTLGLMKTLLTPFLFRLKQAVFTEGQNFADGFQPEEESLVWAWLDCLSLVGREMATPSLH